MPHDPVSDFWISSAVEATYLFTFQIGRCSPVEGLADSVFADDQVSHCCLFPLFFITELALFRAAAEEFFRQVKVLGPKSGMSVNEPAM